MKYRLYAYLAENKKFFLKSDEHEAAFLAGRREIRTDQQRQKCSLDVINAHFFDLERHYCIKPQVDKAPRRFRKPFGKLFPPHLYLRP